VICYCCTPLAEAYDVYAIDCYPAGYGFDQVWVDRYWVAIYDGHCANLVGLVYCPWCATKLSALVRCPEDEVIRPALPE
jgi:hypothetical protein